MGKRTKFEKTKIIEIMYCRDCDEEIDNCMECDIPFGLSDEVYCDEDGNHFCRDCMRDIKEKE